MGLLVTKDNFSKENNKFEFLNSLPMIWIKEPESFCDYTKTLIANSHKGKISETQTTKLVLKGTEYK